MTNRYRKSLLGASQTYVSLSLGNIRFNILSASSLFETFCPLELLRDATELLYALRVQECPHVVLLHRTSSDPMALFFRWRDKSRTTAPWRWVNKIDESLRHRYAGLKEVRASFIARFIDVLTTICTSARARALEIGGRFLYTDMNGECALPVFQDSLNRRHVF